MVFRRLTRLCGSFTEWIVNWSKSHHGSPDPGELRQYGQYQGLQSLLVDHLEGLFYWSYLGSGRRHDLRLRMKKTIY